MLMNVRPITPVNEPFQSNDGGLEDLARSGFGTTNRDMMNRTRQPIENDQKAQGHQANCAKRLENVAPITKPSGAIKPKRLKIRFFFSPGGYALANKASPFGISKAGPIPCIARVKS